MLWSLNICCRYEGEREGGRGAREEQEGEGGREGERGSFIIIIHNTASVLYMYTDIISHIIQEADIEEAIWLGGNCNY